jgi:hypothetical protein
VSITRLWELIPNLAKHWLETSSGIMKNISASSSEYQFVYQLQSNIKIGQVRKLPTKQEDFFESGGDIELG